MSKVLRDKDIRRALLQKLTEAYSSDSQTRILQEFGLCEHSVRIDMAVVNGMMSGFEIKSDSDTLKRLPVQQDIYSKIFDNVIVVVGEVHLDKIKDIVPEWWGIWIAQAVKGKVVLSVVRESSYNPRVELKSIVKCLWKCEAIDIIKECGLYDKKLDRAKRAIIWDIAANGIPEIRLKELIRNSLKLRVDWRIVVRLASDGG